MFDQDYSGNSGREENQENQAQPIQENGGAADTDSSSERTEENVKKAESVQEGRYSGQNGTAGQASYGSYSSQNASGYTAQNGNGQQNAQGWQSGASQQNHAGWQNGSAQQGMGGWQSASGQQNGNGAQNYQYGNARQNAGGYQYGNPYAQQSRQGTGGPGTGNSQGTYSGQNAYGGQNTYQSYQGNYQYGNGNGDYGTAAGRKQKEKKHREKKPGKPMNPFWKKALAVLVSAVCFGVIAGVSFLAVASLGGYQNEIASAAAPAAAEGQADGTASDAQGTDSGSGSSVTTGTTTMVVTDVTEVVEQVMPAIVAITNESVTSIESFWGQTYEQQQESAGSGIIIGENDDELLVVTNNHVVEDATQLYVSFIDNSMVEAQVKGTSPSMDLAVIAVKLEDVESDTRDAITIATLGDSDALKVGEPVIAIGNALGYGQSVTTGVVSALNRVLEMDENGTSNAMIQTDAAINPGNSGGALLDINGQVIGINSNKIGGNAIEGMGYAIPISSARPVIEQLMNQETREAVDEANRGYLGISCINVTSAMAEAYGMPEGIYVAQVYEGTGAEEAGVVKGDIITGINGMTVTTQDDLLNAMQYYSIGETVEITVMHGNPTEGYAEETRTVTLTSQEAMNATEQ